MALKPLLRPADACKTADVNAIHLEMQIFGAIIVLLVSLIRPVQANSVESTGRCKLLWNLIRIPCLQRRRMCRRCLSNKLHRPHLLLLQGSILGQGRPAFARSQTPLLKCVAVSYSNCSDSITIASVLLEALHGLMRGTSLISYSCNTIWRDEII